MPPARRAPSVAGMDFDQAQTRELAVREDAITVSVEDARLGDRFQIAVAPDSALDAFYHPFAYAA
jgi:hypothetical protein